MANKQRYIRGTQKTVRGKIPAGVVAEIGDLIAVRENGEYFIPISEVQTGASGNDENGNDHNLDHIHDLFVGVLVEGATTGDETADTPCLVGYDAVYRYPLDASATADWAPGTLVLPDTTTNEPEDQQVSLSTSTNNNDRYVAIGRVADQVTEGDTEVNVFIFSVQMGQPA